MRKLVIAACAMAAVAAPAAGNVETAASDSPAAAVARYAEAARRSMESIETHPFYADPENRASGAAYVMSMLIRNIEEDVVQDPDFPFFRVLDPRIREGGDNPDQRYLVSPIRGGETYRVWGRMAPGQRRLDLQIYQGDPWIKGGGRSVSTLPTEQIHFDKDGRFSVLLSPTRADGDWVENAPDATKVFIRQIYSEWRDAPPGEVHIDRVGYEGKLKPKLSQAEIARRIDTAAVNLATRIVPIWPDHVLDNYVKKWPANTLSAPASVVAQGGNGGRWMSIGHFDLAPDEALILTTWPMNGNYQGIQLTDLWFSSLEYANRVTSLTGDQAYRTSDGAYHFVVAGTDPGVQNWLDTTGFRRGVVMLRYDGMTGDAFPADKAPRVQKVKLSEVRQNLPKDTPSFGPQARESQIAARRRHVQMRFNY